MSELGNNRRHDVPGLGSPANQESYLSAMSACAWHSFAGWIGPLTIFILIVSKFWMADGFRIDGTHGSALPPVEAMEITLAQSATARGAELPFDLSKISVPRKEILSGGPPKDGIPALSQPKFISAREATYLGPQDRVIGYVRGQEARAYPLKILNYHEIVNDRVSDVPVAVTYCPLCDSASVFDRRTPVGEREFGVSGLLYNSNVLMYDRSGQAESLWSQIKAEGVSGPGAQRKLKSLPVELTTWGDWLGRYPDTLVLSPRTGHARDYSRDPYAGYFQRPELMFPARPLSDRLPTKERVLGVWTDEASRAYPVSAFRPAPKQIVEHVGGKRVVIEYVPAAETIRVVEADEGVEWMYSLWFAWHAFRPETEVFQ